MNSVVSSRRRYYPASPLRVQRVLRGKTLAEVATRAGLSLTRASQIERDLIRPRPGELERLRDAIYGPPSR